MPAGPASRQMLAAALHLPHGHCHKHRGQIEHLQHLSDLVWMLSPSSVKQIPVRSRLQLQLLSCVSQICVQSTLNPQINPQMQGGTRLGLCALSRHKSHDEHQVLVAMVLIPAGTGVVLRKVLAAQAATHNSSDHMEKGTRITPQVHHPPTSHRHRHHTQCVTRVRKPGQAANPEAASSRQRLCTHCKVWQGVAPQTG